MMALAFVGLGTVAANAQCDEFATPATAKYGVATNSFWSNWYIQVGVDMTVPLRTSEMSILRSPSGSLVQSGFFTMKPTQVSLELVK